MFLLVVAPLTTGMRTYNLHKALKKHTNDGLPKNLNSSIVAKLRRMGNSGEVNQLEEAMSL